MTAGDPAPHEPGIAAAIVNYNVGDFLLACVTSLKAAGITDIVVADNGSWDGSNERMLAEHPDVTVIHTGSNLGYGGGANRAAAASNTPYVLVCNADLDVAPDAASQLRAALDDDPTAAIAGPAIDTPAGEVYPSARTFPSIIDSIGHGFLGLFRPGNRFSRNYRLLDWDRLVAAAGRLGVGGVLPGPSHLVGPDRGFRRGLLHVLRGRRPLLACQPGRLPGPV